MLFNTLLYPCFLAIVVAVFWAIPWRFRSLVIIFASLIFYGWSSIAYLLLIALLAIFVYLAGQSILHTDESLKKRKTFLIAITIVVAVLIFFKYSRLFTLSIASLFGFAPPAWSILLPIGISFFTFEFIHYLIEVNLGHIKTHSKTEFFAFAFFFPTLQSGPIKRFQTFVDSLRSHVFSLSVFLSGITYILIGYAQKYLIADSLVIRTSFLSTPEFAPTGFAILSGLFFYSFRLYFDFAGLSNIAIGSALLFGIMVPVNFDRPFLQSDLAAFWRRWHMSLTSWIRDYIFMPLVFRFRNNKYMTVIGLVLTMALVGLWHGSSWNFLFFGMYHGCGLALLQVYRMKKRQRVLPLRLGRVVGVIFTFVFVSFGWGFFVTHSMHDSILLYERVFASLGLT
jgi:alginate O-acetyltransferase complex protein AlgI